MITQYFLRAGCLAWLDFSRSEVLIAVLDHYCLRSHQSLLKEIKTKTSSHSDGNRKPIFFHVFLGPKNLP